MSDTLGDRMKSQYEDRTRFLLPRRTYTIIRLDGRAFHTYTRKSIRPFDALLIEDLQLAAKRTAHEISGAEFAYLQSDEISIVLTDFDKTTTGAWFDGNVQKMASIAASTMTAHFNQNRQHDYLAGSVAMFDARVFTIPDPVEVENYFIWRQKDWIRNSLQMLCRAHFSHKQLHKKNREAMYKMLLDSQGIDWEALEDVYKYGTVVSANTRVTEKLQNTICSPEFTKNRGLLKSIIPIHWEERQ